MVFTAMLLGPWQSGRAAAACAAQDTSRGQVSASFSIPLTGSYRVWSRIKAPDSTNNSYILEIDGTTCGVVVGDSATAANTWTWVNYKTGNSGSPIDINLASGSHSLTAIGREDAVSIDRVIFTADTSCVPSGTGDNCAIVITTPTGGGQPGGSTGATTTGATTTTASSSGGTVTVHASSQPLTVSGDTNLVIAPPSSDNQGASLAKVEYYIDNKLVDTETTAPYTYKVNTKILQSGVHTLTSKAFYADGTSKSTTQTLTVKNTAKKTSNQTGALGVSLLLIAAIFVGLSIIQRRRGGLRLHGVTLIPGNHPVVEDVTLAMRSSDRPGDVVPVPTQAPAPGSVIEYHPTPDETQGPKPTL